MIKNKLNSVLVKILNDGHQVEVKAIGISMYPLLIPGDQLIIEPSLPLIGDIAVFERENKLIAHRVYNIVEDIYFLKGDSLISPDPPIKKQKILGTVISRHRGNKQISNQSISFKIMKTIMPKCTFFLGRWLNYYARAHQKLIRSMK